MGLYKKPDGVKRVLAPRPEGVDPPAILDIGAGSGRWALDMAKEFPHAEVVGLDLTPPNLATYGLLRSLTLRSLITF